jgi:hypothetical protein
MPKPAPSVHAIPPQIAPLTRFSSLSLQVVPEPVEKWQAVGPGRVNLLMEFYKDPARFAYVFQNYAFLTRMMQVCAAFHSPGTGSSAMNAFSDLRVMRSNVQSNHWMVFDGFVAKHMHGMRVLRVGARQLHVRVPVPPAGAIHFQ